MIAKIWYVEKDFGPEFGTGYSILVQEFDESGQQVSSFEYGSFFIIEEMEEAIQNAFVPTFELEGKTVEVCGEYIYLAQED